ATACDAARLRSAIGRRKRSARVPTSARAGAGMGARDAIRNDRMAGTGVRHSNVAARSERLRLSRPARSLAALCSHERLRHERNTRRDEPHVYHAKESRAAEAPVEPASDDDTDAHAGHARHEVPRHLRPPQPDHGVADQSRDARRQKISLQRGAELLRRPSAKRAIDRERWLFHAARATEHARAEPGAEQPRAMVLLQMWL